MRFDFDQQWEVLAAEILSGMKEWRLQHPRATLTEIEAALDERLSRLRARMLEDAALASAAADWSEDTEGPPLCPQCGQLMERYGGAPVRNLQTQGGQRLELKRHGETVHAVHPAGWSFFPLDEELKLLPGDLTPRLAEQLVRLGSWIPSFETAAELLGAFTGGAGVSSATSRRRTEAAGAAYVQLQERAVVQLETEQPAEPQGPAKLFMSVDGAMVPLVGGEWAEVKTLALGEVEAPTQRHGETVIRTRGISYFSRLTDATTLERLALVETHRRGMVTAGAVCAVTDGSEWCQGFVDYHRPDAVRILDFPHAAEHVGQIGQIVFGEGTPQAQQWLSQ
jgi:hypothetical protein